MANKTCMRCGMLMDEFDTDCPCDDPDSLMREAIGDEHRGSRALDADLVREAPAEPIDRMFREAAAAGFEPLTEEQAASFREKLQDFSAVLHGGRR